MVLAINRKPHAAGEFPVQRATGGVLWLSAPQVDVLADKFPWSFFCGVGEQHPTAATARVADCLVIRLFVDDQFRHQIREATRLQTERRDFDQGGNPR